MISGLITPLLLLFGVTQTFIPVVIYMQVPAGAPEISSKKRLLGETLASGDFKHPEKESDSQLFRARLKEIVEELPEDERTVVSLR